MKKSDDQMRFWLPIIVIFGLSSSAFAQLDLGVGGTFRSYPLSGVVDMHSGYGVSLYGSAGSPLSGYVRPNVEIDSAGTYNSALGQLEVFPLAFMGMRAGGEVIQNDKDYTPYKCETSRCRGRFHRTFFGAELSLGAGPVFVHGRWRRERWSQPKEQLGDFIEPTSGLLLRGTGESQTVYYAIAGYKLSDPWTLIGGVRYAEADAGISRMPFGMVRFTSGTFALGVGAGQFESELKDAAFTVWGYLSWELWSNALAVK